MSHLYRTALVVVLTIAAVSGTWAAALIPPAGYACVDTVLSMPAGAWFGGFDVLPNGNFVVADGYTVREIAPTGEVVQTLYSFPSYVYASFVKYNAGNDRVYFGETSANRIASVPASGGEATLLTTLKGNYDLAFSDGVPYVVAGSTVYAIDEATGEADAIATAGSVSGPLIFDADGGLIYGTGNPNWPPTLNDQNIYKWTAAQVTGAMGPGVLTAADAQILAANVDSPSGFAFDGYGRLVFTDSQVAPAVIRVLELGSAQALATTQAADGLPWSTVVRYNPAVGSISAAVSWFDSNWASHTVISTLGPAPMLPEPGPLVTLVSLIGLSGSATLLRSCRK